jgi:exodeoxyribonuclease VII large subunit
MPIESSAESPVAVRTVAKALTDWIGRLGRVWVEGQVTEVTRRPGQATGFLVLRDTAVEMSLRVSCKAKLIDDLDPPLTEGSRIVVWGRPEYWAARGSLTFAAAEIRPLGVGALLARIEALRAVLAAEGLFAADRKRPLPFLPRRIGLITGRSSAAERDVVENAQRRWPSVDFRVEAVAVQGAYAVTEVVDALARLEADPDVDVIVIARGGGSMEDLLPFSDETLLRAVGAAFTPIVSAIGHETDVPLLDHVADRRASTPTDAAKLIVPDRNEEVERIRSAIARTRRCVTHLLDSEQHRIDGLLARPALADPWGVLDGWGGVVTELRARATRATESGLALRAGEIVGLTAQVAALSPQATLDRGYAVIQQGDGQVVRDAADVAVGDRLTARVAAGTLHLVTEADNS